MPTTGWIRESAEDKFSFFIMSLPWMATRLPCPHCRFACEQRQQLIEHLRKEHPLLAPQVLVNGRTASSHWTVREAPLPESISIVNAQKCVWTEGLLTSDVPVDAVVRHLLSRKPRFARLEFSNMQTESGAVVTRVLEVEFKVAEPCELDACDQVFGEAIIAAELKMSDVAIVRAAVPESSSAFDYAGALADFLVGILLKEQEPHAGVLGTMAQYRSKLLGASAVLSGFDRPTSRAVRQVVALNLNQWRELRPGAEFPDFAIITRLVEARETFSAAANDCRRLLEAASKPVCRIDQRSAEFIAATRALMFSNPRDATPAACKRVIEWLHEAGITEADHLKARLLWTIHALMTGDQPSARKGLLELLNDEYFREWASDKLKEFGE